MNNPEERQMAIGPTDYNAGRLSKADFTGNVEFNKVDKKNNVEKQANVASNDVANLDLTNKVEIKFNGKIPASEVKTVSFFNDSSASVGKVAMKSVAEDIGDISAGAKSIEANKIYDKIASLFV